MSTLGTAGNFAGLLSLTIQVIGSINPVISFFASPFRSTSMKSTSLDQIKGFGIMLQSSLDRWRQEAPVDTGATIQILEECHREIMKVKGRIDRPRSKWYGSRQNLTEMARISSAIERCLQGLQVNLALEHSFASYRNGKVLAQEISITQQRVDKIHTEQTQNLGLTSQSLSMLDDKLDSLHNRNLEGFTDVKLGVARAEAELKDYWRACSKTYTANENNYQNIAQGVKSIHHQLTDATSEITSHISALKRSVTNIDHRMDSYFRAQERISGMNEQHTNFQDTTLPSLRQFVTLSLAQLPQNSSERSKQVDSSLGGRKRPLWKRITINQRYKKFETRLFQVYIRSKLICLRTNKTLGNFDLDDRYETEISFRIHPNLWFFKTAFSVSYVRSTYSRLTNLQFQIYNSRPGGALIFEFCSSGNVDGVKSLITRKDASPFDIDSDGWTPLHYAARAHDLAICKLLIHVGASGTALDYSQTSVLHRVFENIRYNQSIHTRDESTRFPDTLRLLVEYAQADPWAADSDGITCIDLAIEKRPLYNAVEEWLMQYQPLEFDPEHYDKSGRTLIHQVYDRFDFSDASRDIDILLALGANVNAPILSLEKSPCHGCTVLHVAAYKFATAALPLMKTMLLECHYFIKKGVDPHILNHRGYTATDIILHKIKEQEDCRLMFWRDMLLDLDIDLKHFLKIEILAHKDVLWFTAHECDEFLLAVFGFAPRYDRLSQAFEYLSHLELQSQPFEADYGHLEFLPPAAESKLLSRWVFADEFHDGTVCHCKGDRDLFGDDDDDDDGVSSDCCVDWYPAPEHEYEPESEDGSEQEDQPQASPTRPVFMQRSFANPKKLFGVGHRGLARFSKYRFEESAWQDWNEWKEYHWAPYREALENRSLENLDASQWARWERYKYYAICGRYPRCCDVSLFGKEISSVPWYGYRREITCSTPLRATTPI